MSKRHAANVYDHLYVTFWHDKEHRFTCFYCGSRKGVQADHVPPVTKVKEYRTLCRDLKQPEKYVKVPSCHSCNSMLSNTLQADPLERLYFLKNLLRTRHKKILTVPEWSQEDLEDAEVEGELRGWISL